MWADILTCESQKRKYHWRSTSCSLQENATSGGRGVLVGIKIDNFLTTGLNFFSESKALWFSISIKGHWQIQKAGFDQIRRGVARGKSFGAHHPHRHLSSTAGYVPGNGSPFTQERGEGNGVPNSLANLS